MSDVALFLWEFTSRRDFAGLYLLLVAFSAAWFGLRSLLTAEARSFGFRDTAVAGEAAIRIGFVWLLVAGIAVVTAVVLLAGG